MFFSECSVEWHQWN